MARLSRTKGPTDLIHDGSRGDTGGFINHQPAGNIATFAFAHVHLRRVGLRPLSLIGLGVNHRLGGDYANYWSHAYAICGPAKLWCVET